MPPRISLAMPCLEPGIMVISHSLYRPTKLAIDVLMVAVRLLMENGDFRLSGCGWEHHLGV